MTWYRIKLALSQAMALNMDALHVLIGTLALLLVAAAMRRSIAAWWPWSIVLAAELLNEWNDLFVERWPDLATQLGESAKDVMLTMVLPTLLLLVARYRPALLANPQAREASELP